MSQTVYVLKQEQGKSYVGISGDFNSRLDQHQFGEGVEWTKISSYWSRIYLTSSKFTNGKRSRKTFNS